MDTKEQINSDLINSTTYATFSSMPIVTAETIKRAIKYLQTAKVEYVPWFKYYKKGGENMGLYKVIFVYPKNNVWETVKVIAKSEENAKIKALKVSNFAEINIDNLVIEVEEMVTWDKEDYK